MRASGVVAGGGGAIAFQGLVFGIVHAGPEVIALLPLDIAMLSAVGIGAGIARWRLGSLWVPIGTHVGADIALTTPSTGPGLDLRHFR